MARTAIVFGMLLCGLTLYGLVAATMKSPFQFVPLMFGIPVLFCGIVGLNPHRRRITASLSALVMLLGVTIGIMETINRGKAWSDSTQFRPVLFTMGVLMTLLCTVYVVTFLIRTARRKGELSTLQQLRQGDKHPSDAKHPSDSEFGTYSTPDSASPEKQIQRVPIRGD